MCPQCLSSYSICQKRETNVRFEGLNLRALLKLYCNLFIYLDKKQTLLLIVIWFEQEFWKPQWVFGDVGVSFSKTFCFCTFYFSLLLPLFRKSKTVKLWTSFLLTSTRTRTWRLTFKSSSPSLPWWPQHAMNSLSLISTISNQSCLGLVPK